MLLCAALSMGMLSGCGGEKPEADVALQKSTEQGDKKDLSDGSNSFESPYEVRMITTLPTDAPGQDEIDRVIEKVNEITLEKLNMTLKLEFLPYSSYEEQISLELSEGSDIDLLTVRSVDAQNWVSAGYLVDMTDLLDEYGKDIIDTYTNPEYAKAAIVNGYIYGMPVHKEVAQQPTIFFRTDVLNQYGIDVSNVDSLADVDAIYEEVAAKEPGMWMLAADNLGSPKTFVCDESVVGGTSYVVGLTDIEDNTTVTNLLEADGFKDQFRRCFG